MQNSYVINGKYLSQRITGVQRYAIEIVNALDKLIPPGKLEIAVPPNVQNIPQYQNIQVKQIGHLKGNLWEQLSFPLYAWRQGRIPLNFCNVAPLVNPGIVCIDDVKIKRRPDFFTKKFVLWYRLLFWNSVQRARLILTISEFSKAEIMDCYHLPAERIRVVLPAWQHFQRIGYEKQTLGKYGLLAGQFFFSMSSLDPNKNFRWIADAARQYPEYQFAVAGSVNEKVFSEKMAAQLPPNMRFLGYVSDEEAKALMRNCRAFLFPSFYEGFGLPPLEALSAGAKSLVVSDIPVMREIFGTGVDYINPHAHHEDLTKLHKMYEVVRDDILTKYSWEKSAKELLSVLNCL